MPSIVSVEQPFLAAFRLFTKTRQGGSFSTSSLNRRKVACARGERRISIAPISSSASGGAVSTVRTVDRSAGAMMGSQDSFEIHAAT